jgi:hypothetical protein
VSWEIRYGKLQLDVKVMHRCDNPRCVNPSHLFLGTQQDNVADRQQKGRQARQKGEAHGRAKLTEQQVRELRRSYAGGTCSQEFLAKEYGVAQSKVSEIVAGKLWSHVVDGEGL